MKRTLSYLIGLFICVGVRAQSSLQQFLQSPAIQGANVGVKIQNLTTGKQIVSYHSSTLVPPASVLKLITTATALETWGDDHRFATELRYSGKIKDGVLDGDLYIVGKGDPTLGGKHWGKDSFFNEWIAAIRRAGIKRINGGVVADVSYYDQAALNPNWIKEDIGNYYAPGIFALSYLDNTLTFQLKSGAVGTAATLLKTDPELPDLKVKNEVRCTTIDHDGAYVYGLPCRNERYLTGEIPSNLEEFALNGDLPNPALLLATHLTQRLTSSSIAVRDGAKMITQASSTPTTLIYTHQSHTLEKIIEETNTYSVNLQAEMIFRNLASFRKEPCSIANAAAYTKQFWLNKGVDLSTAVMVDGCGLSPRDRVNADELVSLLTYMSHSQHFLAFYQSLPVSGKPGTLKDLWKKTELEGRVHAKSGTIKSTRNYAGYITMPNGEQLVFAIFVSGSSASGKQIKKAIEKYLLDVYSANK